MATQLAEQIEEPLVVAEDAGDEGEPQQRDFDAEARAHGWTPKEDFKGDPSRWVDAETFVTRADEVMPLLKKQNKALKDDIAELKRMVNRLTKAEQAAYNNAMSDIEARRLEAVRTGDEEAFTALDKQANTLRKEAEADVADGEDPQEAYESFRETNGWYDRANLASATDIEIEARVYADRLADRYVKQGLQKEVSPSEFFARIASETEAKFPLLKVRKGRDKPLSAVAGVTNGGTSTRGAKIGANLPADCKETAERYMRQGIFRDCKTKEEAYNRFAKDYTGPWN